MSEFGDFFKRLRIDRNVQLATISEKMSISNLNRFENGLIDSPLTMLTDLWDVLGMDPEDLRIRGLIDQNQLDAWGHIASERWNEETVQALIDYLASIKIPAVANAFIDVMTQVLEELVKIHQKGVQTMAMPVVIKLDRYLQKIAWPSRLERMVVLATMEYVPIQIAASWTERFFKYVETHQQSVTITQSYNIVTHCAVVGERAAIERRLDIMEHMVINMASLLNQLPENAVISYNFQSIKALFELLSAPSEMTRKRLVAVVETTKIVMPSSYYQHMRQYTIDQSWLTEKDYQGQ